MSDFSFEYIPIVEIFRVFVILSLFEFNICNCFMKFDRNNLHLRGTHRITVVEYTELFEEDQKEND